MLVVAAAFTTTKAATPAEYKKLIVGTWMIPGVNDEKHVYKADGTYQKWEEWDGWDLEFEGKWSISGNGLEIVVKDGKGNSQKAVVDIKQLDKTTMILVDPEGEIVYKRAK